MYQLWPCDDNGDNDESCEFLHSIMIMMLILMIMMVLMLVVVLLIMMIIILTSFSLGTKICAFLLHRRMIATADSF